MILIVTEKINHFTDKVIEWLNFNKSEFVRLNHDDMISHISVSISDKFKTPEIVIQAAGKRINLFKINTVWYHKGAFAIEKLNLNKDEVPDTHKDLLQQIILFHQKEWNMLTDFVWMELLKKRCFGNYFNRITNKLQYLVLAQSCGLKIPDTRIISCKNDFSKEHLISKPISEIINTTVNEKRITTYTSCITESSTIKEKFFPSLFQENIKKKYELRIFFFKNKIWTMAIFSQATEQTKVDYRRYNTNKPNRNVPYRLPESVENKIRLFAKKSGLLYGSIDMIVTTDYEYVFLEVNPFGVIPMVSEPCNYKIEKDIAEILSN